jgi:PTH2 family peptidyl-tRNA hydrolase
MGGVAMRYKQVIIFRKDLLSELGKGKMAAHVAHAAVGSFNLAREDVRESWNEQGGAKIVLRVDGLRELNEIYKKAKGAKLPCFLVTDAGLTQLKPGTITCLGIGPAEERKIDSITGKLRLL